MKQVFSLLGIAILLLFAYATFNAMNFGSSTEQSVDDVIIELKRENIPERLAEALMFKTISEQDKADIDYETFVALHAYIDAEFPLIREKLTKEVVNDYSLLYTWQGSNSDLQPVLLLSHMDVVPVVPGTEDKWLHQPFSGDIADGVIWGRGAVDDKLSVFGILEAVEYLLDENYQPKRTYYLAFGHDEEKGGPDGAKKIGELLRDRGVKALYGIDEGGFVIDGSIAGLERDIAMVNVSEKGYVSLQLSVTGAGGHSSAPLAETAVSILSHAVANVSDNKFPVDTSVLTRMGEAVAGELLLYQKAIIANLGLLEPIIEVVAEKNPLLNAFTRTSTAPTMLSGSPKENVLPIFATAVINHRIMPGETIESTMAFVENAIDDERVKVTVINESTDPSPVSSTTDSGYLIITKTIQQVSSEDPVIVPGMLQAGTDTKHYVEVADNLYRFIFTKVDPTENVVHGTDERVEVESYLNTIRFFVQLIINTDESQ